MKLHIFLAPKLGVVYKWYKVVSVNFNYNFYASMGNLYTFILMHLLYTFTHIYEPSSIRTNYNLRNQNYKC